jgi:hypothetical protein
LPRRGGFGVVPFSIPLGLMAGRPFRPFNRAISSRCSAMMPLERRHLAQQLHHELLQRAM